MNLTVSDILPQSPPIAPCPLHHSYASASTAPSIVVLPAAPASFAPQIVADFPALFAEFRGKRFTLLWRGSRDGFRARHFHGRCDGHAPTLTLIQDTMGNVFGGFTPVEWDSSEDFKADPSLKSFLFTLKNPHNFRARKFALEPEEKDEAIDCDSKWGPIFGEDFGVSDNCNANTRSCSDLGCYYANDTDLDDMGLDGHTVFTGSRTFTVKEIEVLEVAE